LQEPVLARARLRHLASRFFGYLAASGLTPAEQQKVRNHLDAQSAALFWAQTRPDQRHAFDVAERAAALAPGDEEAYTAALLHDIGKRHAGLGAIGRSIATVLDGLGLPMTTSMYRYRAHGPIGAAELESAGLEGIVVVFARHHPGAPPPGINAERWQALLDADG
jgi:putative nucleotidyltransferase with HDIG domain